MKRAAVWFLILVMIGLASAGWAESQEETNPFDTIPNFEDSCTYTTVKFRDTEEYKWHQSYAGAGAGFSHSGAFRFSDITRSEAIFEENHFVFVRLNNRFCYFMKGDFVLSTLPEDLAKVEPEFREAVTLSAITPSWTYEEYIPEKEFVAAEGIPVKVFFKQNGYAYAEYSCKRGLVRMWLPVDGLALKED